MSSGPILSSEPRIFEVARLRGRNNASIRNYYSNL